MRVVWWPPVSMRCGAPCWFVLSRGALFGIVHAIGLTLDDDDLRVVHEPVNDGHDAGRVGEHLAPFSEWSVGGDDSGLELVTTVDDVEQQICVPIGV